MMLKTSVLDAARLGWKMTCGYELEQSCITLPINLIRPLPVQDHKGEMFQRLALPLATGLRGGVDYGYNASS